MELTMPNFSVEPVESNTLRVRHTDISAGWSQRYLLISDVHFDSIHCDRKMLTRHLNEALATDAGIFCFGDWFDAMGGKNDRRGSKGSVRDEDNYGNYFDRLVDNSLDFLSRYADNMVMLSEGNHESAITRHNEIDIMRSLCRQLGVHYGMYSGWVKFLFGLGGRKSSSKNMHYHHGSGGGGPVTKGVIRTNRDAASSFSDIYVAGHIHEAWYVENVVSTLTDACRERVITQYHVQLPTYKNESVGGGYHVEKGRPVKPMGGWWLTFSYDPSAWDKIKVGFERAA
jgi:UDP-2,3-diacylglucosamine pyrophosphatase LpxH